MALVGMLNGSLPNPGFDAQVYLSSRVFGRRTGIYETFLEALSLGRGGTGANLSATGGTSQVLKQVSAGAVVTVGQLSASDLSDYVTGAWTPVDASGADLVFTAATGKYTKIGRLVVVAANFDYPVTADATAAKIGGLPFNVGPDAENRAGATMATTEGTVLWPLLVEGTATALIRTMANLATSKTNANMSGTTNYFSAVYFTT